MAKKKKDQHITPGPGSYTPNKPVSSYNAFTGSHVPIPGINSAPPVPTAPAPAANALPPDASYEQVIAALGRTRDNTISDLTGQRTRTLADYGYTGQFDENGKLTGQLTVDPNNAFSRASALKRNYDQAHTGNVNSYAARGQLYAGSLKNAQNANDFSYQAGQDAMQKALGSYLAQIVSGIGTARTNYETGSAQAYADRVARAPQNPLYSPTAAPAPVASAPAPAGGMGQQPASYGQSLGDHNDPVIQTVQGKDSRGRPGVWRMHKSGKRTFTAA